MKELKIVHLSNNTNYEKDYFLDSIIIKQKPQTVFKYDSQCLMYFL